VVGFLSADEAATPTQPRAVYIDERYELLVQIRTAHGVFNPFRVNDNVVPA